MKIDCSLLAVSARLSLKCDGLEIHDLYCHNGLIDIVKPGRGMRALTFDRLVK